MVVMPTLVVTVRRGFPSEAVFLPGSSFSTMATTLPPVPYNGEMRGFQSVAATQGLTVSISSWGVQGTVNVHTWLADIVYLLLNVLTQRVLGPSVTKIIVCCRTASFWLSPRRGGSEAGIWKYQQTIITREDYGVMFKTCIYFGPFH